MNPRPIALRRLAALAVMTLVLPGMGCKGTLETFHIPAINHRTTWIGTADHNPIACPYAQILLIPIPGLNIDCTDGLGYGFGLDTQGTGPSPDVLLEDDQIAIGFARYNDPGTEPCPCWSYSSVAYRGEFMFPLFNLPGKHSELKTITAATLIFTFAEFIKGDGDVGSNEPFDILGGIYVRVPPSDDLKGKGGFFPGGPAFPKPAVEEHLVPFPDFAKIVESDAYPEKGFPIRRKDHTIFVDVSNQVRSWVKDKESNLGLMFRSRDESIPTKQNIVRVVKIGNIHLDVLANPTQ